MDALITWNEHCLFPYQRSLWSGVDEIPGSEQHCIVYGNGKGQQKKGDADRHDGARDLMHFLVLKVLRYF